MNATQQPQDPAAFPDKQTVSGSVPPPPVVSDCEVVEPHRSFLALALAKLGWVFAPSSRGRFFRARVSLLLAVLACVLLWGATDCYQRRARTEWRRTLNVGVVLVERRPIRPSTLGRLSDRAYELERRLASEYKRHGGRDFTPFSFTVRGPVKMEQTLPDVQEETLFGLLKYTFGLWRFTRDIDARAGVDSAAYDARIYLVMKPAEQQGPAFVEGVSQFGGRVGIAQADIDPEMIDLSLFVATHELMHTLGASDKYDTAGRAIYPDGFAEPDKAPLYPQRGAEIMARNVPAGLGSERPPNTLDELIVGSATAREIGWAK